MAFTRFHDDPARIKKQLQESTGPGRYILNVPGNGLSPSYMADPFIRLQKWGANLRTNTINLESDLKGLNNNLNRDCNIKKTNRYGNIPNNKSSKIHYPTNSINSTEQSRVTHPAWMYRDLEQATWNGGYLPLNPQENTCLPFHNNANTRLIASDTFNLHCKK